jgi:hypothetical protein
MYEQSSANEAAMSCTANWDAMRQLAQYERVTGMVSKTLCAASMPVWETDRIDLVRLRAAALQKVNGRRAIAP